MKKSKLAYVISTVLITAAIVWLSSILAKDWGSVYAIFSRFQPANFIYFVWTTLQATLAVGLLFFVFQKILSRRINADISSLRLAAIFFSGQIIRYLPGRFFGVAYQVSETHRDIPALTMVRVNVEFMLLVVFFNALVPFCILLGMEGQVGTACMVLLGGLFCVALHLRFDWIDRCLVHLKRFLPERVASIVHTADRKDAYPVGTIIEIISIFLCYYALYFTAWFFLKDVFPDLSGSTAIRICAHYTLSWVVGFLSIVTPAGLGVREILFMLLSAHTIPSYQASFLAIFFRLWLILIDLILFFVVLALWKIFGKSKPAAE